MYVSVKSLAILLASVQVGSASRCRPKPKTTLSSSSSATNIESTPISPTLSSTLSTILSSSDQTITATSVPRVESTTALSSESSSSVSSTTVDSGSSANPTSSNAPSQITTIESTSTVATTSSATSATDYPVPTPGVAQPTRTYTGGIQVFSTGTPVSINNPSFENVGASKLRKRQSSAQQAAAADGWNIQSCGTGTISDCVFENYDAADGTWAFAGKNGGLVYQDNVKLFMGATYQFTFYYKVVSTYSGATSSSTGNFVNHRMALGDTTNTNVNNIAPVGQATVESGHDWAMQTLTISNMQCQYAHFGKVQPDGSVAFRMFINAYSSGSTLGDYIWYMDEVRVQQTNPPPSSNYIQSQCGITPPSASTTAAPTSTYTVTQTYQPSADATPSILAENALYNPSFEKTAFTDYNVDNNGGVLKAVNWTASGCAQKQCALNNGNGNPPACQDGTYCETWLSPAAWSQTVTLVVGATYWLSFWTMLSNAASTTGSSVLSMTMEPAGAAAGSGGLVLSANMPSNQGWTQYGEFLHVNRDFAVNVCGAAATDVSVRCQVTIGGTYSGAWSRNDGVKNYFDNISVNRTAAASALDR